MQGDEFEAEGVNHTPEDHVGIALRQKRIELGRELTDIARQTRIPLRHLTAIETGQHDSLPALPYTIGFVKSYARTLGLDPDAVAERFRAETTKTDRIVPMIDHEPIEEARVPTRRAAVLGLALLAFVILAVVAYGFGAFDNDEAVVVASSEMAGSGGEAPTVDAAPATTPVASPPAAAPAATAALSGPIVVAAREDAWIKIYDAATGTSLFMGVMAAGDRYEVPADRQDLLLQTGRIGMLDFSVGGTALPSLGAPTEFVKDLPLTAAALSSRVPPAVAGTSTSAEASAPAATQNPPATNPGE